MNYVNARKLSGRMSKRWNVRR